MASGTRKVNQQYAERFEIYWKGIELGMPFMRSVQAVLLERWQASNAHRANKRPPHPIDQDFIEAN